MYKPHAYLAFGGTIGPDEGFEDWATGIRFGYSVPNAPDVPPTEAVLQEYLNDNIVQALADWFTSPALGVSPQAKMTWVKFNAIGADGRYDNEQTVETPISAQAGGGASSNGGLRYPSQVSLVVTLETGANRGYANRGRMYIPCPTWEIGANGLISASNAQTVADHTATFLSSVTDGVEDSSLNRWDFFPAVESKLGNGGDGTERAITRVSVDTRLDIQRSRAKSLRGSRRSAGV